MTDIFRTKGTTSSSPSSPPARRCGPGRSRTAAIAVTALVALTGSTLPAWSAGPGGTRADRAPRQIEAEPRPGAETVGLSAPQRRKLLSAATDSRTDTARSLKLGAREKLIPKDVVKDADGTVHTRYERTFAGLPVLGGDLVVHERGTARTVSRSSPATVSIPTTKATVTAAKAALKAAASQKTGEAAAEGAPRLVVWAGDGVAEPVLAWESLVTGVQEDGTPSRLRVVTDADSGARLGSFEQVHSGTGASRYSGTVQVGSVRDGDLYRLTDPQRGGHTTYDISAGGNGVPLTDDNDVWGDGTPADPQTAAVDAAYGAQQTWDFYHDRFGRNGIADDGVGARSRVHYGKGYANAFWDDLCFCMTYGDGLDDTRPLTELDIAAHEMTHGVTSATANLTYSGESGGLNEATSDIMGTAVEFFADNAEDVPDYRIGELADVRGTGKPLRYMDQPSKDASAKGTSQDHWTEQTRKLDPHFSSGVANHFFYLLAEGSGEKTVKGIAYDSPTYDGLPVAGLGLHNATNVWYRALTRYMTSGTDYAGARTATLQAAADLFGRSSDAYEAVGNAWAAVNVGPRYVNHIAAATPAARDSAVGQPTSRQVEATTTRPGALTYSATGLPDGLSVDAATGLVSGTPATAGAFPAAVTIRNSAAETRTLSWTWTVLASGGDHFVNPARFDIPNWRTVESPITVTGREGKAAGDLKVTVDLVHDFIGGQVIHLVGEDGTALLVKDFVWDTGSELHATFTVDASALPADGTWKLRVTDNTPGIFTVDPGYLDGWSLDF
ncbi:Zn-dependent metalloprotease [Streptomyces sp. V3I8]|uniref:M4 family metallopeptidase n=1 Tax=Streptomyces sp. V3I8 TaxID=3042279 RepID=UPI00277FC71E|nr:M4 family metallopeptidase [Streptomyces sp. V3I8]MDQ1040917.1 Zn-dependent metalloprotease [Streptomyces sp. V3I8]